MSRPNVLVTGSAGFVGSNLMDYIISTPYWMDKYKFWRLTRKVCDLNNELAIQKTFTKYNPDYVIHLAAQCGGIGANQMYPATFWDENLRMSMNLFNACAVFKTKKIITLGTVCSYGRNAPIPFKEESLYTEWPEITNRPYGVAKLALYEGLRAYNVQSNMPFSYLIPTNMYGLYDNYATQTSHVIPSMILKMNKAKDTKTGFVTLWGDGTPTRDFLNAQDACRAILACLETDTGNEPMNLGSNEEISMLALAEMIADIVGFKGDIVWDQSKPNGQPRRKVDWTRAKETLFWEPRIKLYDGIKKLQDWITRPATDKKKKDKESEEE